MCALHVRSALVFAGGSIRAASRLIGCDYHMARRILERDNARIERDIASANFTGQGTKSELSPSS